MDIDGLAIGRGSGLRNAALPVGVKRKTRGTTDSETQQDPGKHADPLGRMYVPEMVHVLRISGIQVKGTMWPPHSGT
jgi:hypothetical protein